MPPPNDIGTVLTRMNLDVLAPDGRVAPREPGRDRGGEPDEAGINTPREHRRYVITADRFRCGDESGPDWFGSDEVRWVFTTKREGEEPTTSVSRKFGNVDSGDEREFSDNQDDLAPAQGDLDDSVPAPVGISIQLIEEDQGEDLETVVQTAFTAGALIPGVGPWVAQTPGFVRDELIDALENDLMGSSTVAFRARNLERRLPTIGSAFVDKLYFGGQGGDLPFAVAGGPDYHLYVRVERVADAE